ncbi:MAG: glycosyltransferase family 4 protein [Verrucomicrobia bacterium]|nr:glycosyltransferase family 4 protein [Verrucomicrobiota bacterium]
MPRAATPLPPRRLAIVVSHPIQYYAPWFRHLAVHRPELELKVFYLSDHGQASRPDAQFGTAFAWDTDLLSGYACEFVPNLATRPDVTRFSGLHNPGLRPALRAFAPEAILLFGYAYRPHLALILRPPAPILFRGDSHLLGLASPASFLAQLAPRSLLKRLLFSRCSAFLPVGTANAAYFRHYGVPAENCFLAPHAVDAAHFTITPERLATAAAQRDTLGIPATAPVALFAGKLIPKKRPDLLLAAFIEAAVPGAHLVFSGDGELLPQLRAAAAGLPYVHFLPFANQSAMPARYLLGDVFVLPSEGRHETWGLAVNEAMHLARPCIVSDHVGCAADLVGTGSVEQGAWNKSQFSAHNAMLPSPGSPLLAPSSSLQTGWVFPAGDQTALAATLRSALTLPPAELAACGQAAARRVTHFSYEAAAAGLTAALQSVFKC